MGYSTLDIENGLKIDRERLRVWTSKGFVAPSIPSPGRGRKAEFTLLDVYCVALFSKLVGTFGMSRKVAAEFVDGFKAREQATGKHGENVSHILFRLETVDGESKIRTMTFGEPGEWAMTLSDGRWGMYDPEGRVPFRPFDIPGFMGDSFDDDYDGLQIINFKKIRQVVRAAFPG